RPRDVPQLRPRPRRGERSLGRARPTRRRFHRPVELAQNRLPPVPIVPATSVVTIRSEEHTSELQSLAYLVCRLLLEKKTHRVRATRASRRPATTPTEKYALSLHDALPISTA